MKSECLVVSAIGNANSEERILADKHFEIFNEAADKADLKAIRIDTLSAEVITPVLWDKLRSSYMVIADLSVPNPNSAYELGIRHGLQMPVLIVTNNIKDLPFDFKDYNAYEIRYDGNDAVEIAKRLRTPIKEIQNTVFKNWQFRIVPPHFTDDRNVNFYESYMEALRNARKGVLMVGSGFDNESSMMLPFMRVLSGCAMRVSMTRVETAGREKLEWWKMVAKFLLPMPNFKLFVPKNPDDVILKDIGLIDWHDEQRALVELMFHTNIETGNPYDFSSKMARRAGYAFFAHSKQLAMDLFNIIDDMKDRDKLIRLDTAEDIARHFNFEDGWHTSELIDEKGLYFAYGSNMHIGQMKNRAGSFNYKGVAMAKDYELTFSIPGTIFSGAVANIKPIKGGHVYGVLYDVDSMTIDKMDFFEGVQQGEYRRTKINVILDDSDKVQSAWVYYSNNSSVLSEKPSQIYLDRMIEGAKHHNLPECYIDSLLKFETI